MSKFEVKYKNGLSIKPDAVSETGVVTFTDGTTTGLLASQVVCEAYGYRYDKTSGTCQAGTLIPTARKKFANRKNKETGVNNTIRNYAQNSFIVGENNINNGGNANTFILGNNHVVENTFNNSSILGGERAIISREAEVSIGGGVQTVTDSTSAVSFNSRRQTSTLELSCVTIDNTPTNLTIQGDGSSFINVKNNSIIGFDIYVTRLELGGTRGVAGNYSYRNIRGAVKIDNSYNMSFVIGFERNIAKIGVNGTCNMVDSTTGGVPSITVQCTDRNTVNNLWSASVTLHEVISETTF